MNISIIIPTYNGISLLKKYLPHLLKNFDKNNEIIIVDNHSEDNTYNYIKSYPILKYIKLGKNLGFTGACNQGAQIAKSRYLLFLNNDCLITGENIRKLYIYLEENEKIIATQPIVYNSKKSIENIGYTVNFKVAKAKNIVNKNYNFSINIDFIKNNFYGLSATCLLIKKDIFINIGGFDKNFHSYLEDIDLFIRLAKLNYQYRPCINSYCIHEHMATSSKMNNYKQKQDFKNWIRIIIKNYPVKYIIKYFPSLILERFRNINGIIKSRL